VRDGRPVRPPAAADRPALMAAHGRASIAVKKSGRAAGHRLRDPASSVTARPKRSLLISPAAGAAARMTDGSQSLTIEAVEAGARERIGSVGLPVVARRCGGIAPALGGEPQPAPPRCRRHAAAFGTRSRACLQCGQRIVNPSSLMASLGVYRTVGISVGASRSGRKRISRSGRKPLGGLSRSRRTASREVAEPSARRPGASFLHGRRNGCEPRYRSDRVVGSEITVRVGHARDARAASAGPRRSRARDSILRNATALGSGVIAGGRARFRIAKRDSRSIVSCRLQP
jgi:hypothetical protein